MKNTKLSYRCSSYKKKCLGMCDRSAIPSYNFGIHSATTSNVTEDMNREVGRLAVTTTYTRSSIWETVRAMFYGVNDHSRAIESLSWEQMLRRVNRTKAEKFGGSVYGPIEASPWSQVLSDNGTGTDKNFLLFHYSYYDRLKKRESVFLVGHILYS
ncbi:hypothetical protein PHMEG_00026898 [Phytophthora megakarya]|uniref:Uncharacterized protein n=1 Tax=Phytophthora megakarya TaxID=4795 RepID=A0A225V9N2_9STRA|nr:hypothetical protein PHMEG_00026898 [Phytophthora megakarya]